MADGGIMRLFVNVVISGLGLGAIYALFALGYSLVYSILGLMNLSHGDVFMLGTFIGFGFLEAGASPLIAVAVGVMAGGLLATTVDQTAYRPLRATGDNLGPLIAALGVALIFRNIATASFGVRTKFFPPLVGEGNVTILGSPVSIVPLISLALAAAFIVAFNAFLQRARWGWAIQAAAQDLPTARLMGVPVTRTVALVYFLAGAMGVLGGVLYASVFSVLFIGMGWIGTLKAFTAAILGGIGNLYGAVLGGLMLGLMESLSSVYISSQYRDAISFGIVILVFLLRPQGLLGKGAVARA